MVSLPSLWPGFSLAGRFNKLSVGFYPRHSLFNTFCGFFPIWKTVENRFFIGFYLLLAGNYTSRDIVPLITEMYEFIRDFKDAVPGASPKDCGNYLDMNLSMANYLAKKYLDQVLYGIDDSHLVYPES